MVKPPIIICEPGDVHLYDSIGEAANSMESIDVVNGEYVVYDSDGHVLDLHVDELYIPHGLLGRICPAIGPVEIRGRKEAQPRESELRDMLVKFLLRLKEHGWSVRADNDWFAQAPLSELIHAVREVRWVVMEPS